MPCKVTDLYVCAAICKRLEIQVHQFPDAINGVVSGRVRADKFVIERIVALPPEHRGCAFAPYPLDRGQDPNFIVHQDVVIRNGPRRRPVRARCGCKSVRRRRKLHAILLGGSSVAEPSACRLDFQEPCSHRR
jgi:hypothetical protein